MLTWPGERAIRSKTELPRKNLEDFSTPDPDAQRLLDDPTPDPVTVVTDTTLDTPLKRALHAHLTDAAQAVAVAKAINATKKHGWRGNPIKEREIKRAIYEVVNDDQQTDALFNVLCRLEEPASPTETDASYTVTHYGDWTWISFTRKPSEAVRERLKSEGFRWGRRRKAWYVRQIVSEGEVASLLAG